MWSTFDCDQEITWGVIKYEAGKLAELPEANGVYAFVAKPSIAQLADCNYLLYIGKAERQTLKTRCRQYLAEARRPKGRMLIKEMLTYWSENLYLYYAQTDEDGISPGDLEEKLLSAYIPPMNSDLPGELSSIAKGIYRT